MTMTSLSKRVIIVFGFSGSGKSTLTRSLAREYGLRVVHPSGILRDLYEGKRVDLERTRYNTGFWESDEGLALFTGRLEEQEPLDLVSDRILLQEVERGGVVIDSWSLPWLTKKGRRIYLKAALEVRARRVASRSGIVYERALAAAVLKDEGTRQLFRRTYGFDIATEHDVFDLVIDTDTLDAEEVLAKALAFLA
jgi:cytidylate kinase